MLLFANPCACYPGVVDDGLVQSCASIDSRATALQYLSSAARSLVSIFWECGCRFPPSCSLADSSFCAGTTEGDGQVKNDEGGGGAGDLPVVPARPENWKARMAHPSSGRLDYKPLPWIDPELDQGQAKKDKKEEKDYTQHEQPVAKMAHFSSGRLDYNTLPWIDPQQDHGQDKKDKKDYTRREQIRATMAHCSSGRLNYNTLPWIDPGLSPEQDKQGDSDQRKVQQNDDVCGTVTRQ
jgi:aspartate-semialdehyde dehydrogenase